MGIKIQFFGQCDLCTNKGQQQENLPDGVCYNLDMLHWDCSRCGRVGFVPESIGWEQPCYLNISFRKTGSAIQSISSNSTAMPNPVFLRQVLPRERLTSVSIMPSDKPFMDNLSRTMQISDRILIVHGHSRLPKGPEVSVPQGNVLYSYTEPGKPIYSSQTLEILLGLEKGLLLEAASPHKESNDVRPRPNRDCSPNYRMTFDGSHNKYEELTAPYSLGVWVYDSTATPRLQQLPLSLKSMDVSEAFKKAQDLRINYVLIFGCKNGELAGELAS